jgi:hypothetical protein
MLDWDLRPIGLRPVCPDALCDLDAFDWKFAVQAPEESYESPLETSIESPNAEYHAHAIPPTLLVNCVEGFKDPSRYGCRHMVQVGSEYWTWCL